ncbi:unnamed protein product [Rotaria sordida]|uniref:Rab-GAP TBC domain-containing protein n=1 Tax=Rotaria sordida TaxID=392033 RepID=A0A818RYQ0_9BILA|nr:unnamed protein product [Rotaria sordida]CAF1045886.1 unnamed protein product [Rotaria sordida]CAF1076800.1 unnamed protein product [Rotaria sordida]CAF3660755.1 unnamed protein product [Rotaria sordida]CAF3670949.1 unnamed protein product [Rotaria sordida]
MNIELVPERQYQAFNSVAGRHHHHQPIWQNIKNLLKSCFGTQSDSRLLNRDGSLIDINRLRQNINDKQQSYKKRHITWPYLLNIYSPSMTNSDKKIYQNRARIRYNRLKRTWQERVSQGDSFYVTLADTILKDVRRTDRHIKFFKKKKQILFNIMMTYSVYHPNPGYSQGMTDMLTPIVYVFIDESMSYFAFCSLMNRYMSSLFDQDQIEINRRIRLFNLILHSIDNELWNKINVNEENYLYVYRWLLLDCKREFYRFNHVLRVLELVWINSISPFVISQSITNYRSLFTIFICISILQEDRQIIFSYSNDEDLHKYFFSSSSSSRSHRSTKRILQQAQINYSNYILSQK